MGYPCLGGSRRGERSSIDERVRSVLCAMLPALVHDTIASGRDAPSGAIDIYNRIDADEVRIAYLAAIPKLLLGRPPRHGGET